MCPRYILSHNRTEFKSSHMDQVLQQLGIDRIFSAPYDPQINGKFEVFHKYLKPTLKKLYEKDPSHWDKYLKQVLTSYRVTPNLATAEMPIFLVYGRDPNLPLHQLLDALANLGNWAHDAWQFQLVEDWGRRRGIRLSPPLEPHLQELLSGEEMFLASVTAGDSYPWTSMTHDPKSSPMQNAEWIQWHAQQVDTCLVAGAAIWHQPWKPLVICMKSVCIISSAKSMKSCNGGKQWPLHTTSPLVPGEIQIHTACRPMIWQQRLPPGAATADPHLHEGPSILGRESPTADPWWALPIGGECVGIQVGNGAPGYLCRWGSSCRCCAL